MKRRKIEPYLQGDLDALCGTYAIINACALILPHLRGTEFFANLFDDLVKASGSRATSFLLHGLGIADVERLLEAAKHSVRRRLSLTLTWSRPFKQSGSQRQSDCLPRLRDHVGHQRTVCVIALGHPHFRYHWTAVRAVTDRAIKIADSCNHKSVRLGALQANGQSAKDGKGWKPQATFFIQITGDVSPIGELHV